MTDIDLNLLPALDALLDECSVTAAARRLGLSASAMSRTLARLRSMTGDPLLVRAGNGLVPTPRAMAMQDRVRDVARNARTLLGPQATEVDPATLARTFVVRANEGFIALLAAALVTAVAREAPRVRLRFVPRVVKDAVSLREGQVDLEIGVLGQSAPEIRTRSIFRDRFVGVARMDHPLLRDPVTPAAYAACQHVVASRKADFEGPIDRALAELGLRRTIVAVVPGFPDALRIARDADVLAQVPRSLMRGRLPGAAALAEGLVAFELPVLAPEIVVSAMWHPRMDREPAHKWLRDIFIAVCRDALDE
ncbi:LysR family transcriptional regulator [Caballeronia sp. LZ034LL]|uniref:LysR family transcriptional regulator n=1 Tax=Caballeronia sp. LZ034LL TaxID=3038567 RepID=UPI00285DA279|nr:LysR family transcriptional regulator [Caballeronia sp. LZ034LL]MDR5835740.1 LysR family transcriptional regulator [Caballeronia sp. LZ034LL]